MTLRLSLLGGAAACDVASPRRLELDAVLAVRRAGAAELEAVLLPRPGLVVVEVLASGRLPGPVVEAKDKLDPGLLPAALLDAVLMTVVEPIALMGLRIVDGGLG